MQASFPGIYTYRLWLISWYTWVTFGDCDFFNEVFSFEFFYMGAQAHTVYMCLVCHSLLFINCVLWMPIFKSSFFN